MDTTGSFADPVLESACTLLRECSPRSPYRAPDWRWRLANFVASGGRPPRRRWIDAPVVKAVRFLDFVEGRRRRRPPGFAVTEEAYRLHTGLDAVLGEEIVLRLLSGQAYCAVADRCGLASAVVEAYARLFFDVSEQLENCDYIGGLVFGRAAYKIIAYNLGPIAVPHLVGFLRGPVLDGPAANGDVTTDGHIHRALWRLIRIMSQPLNAETSPGILRLNAVIDVLDRSARSRPRRPITAMPDAGDRLLAAAFERAERTGNHNADGVSVGETDPNVVAWLDRFARTTELSVGGIDLHRATG